MTVINFREHNFRVEGKYKCKCGCRFKKVTKTCWTENPFNKLWVAGKIKELNTKYQSELKEYSEKKKCPKCGLLCHIIGT